MDLGLTVRNSMDYYALEWKKRSIFGEIGYKSPFGKELQASRLGSMPIFQEKSGAARLEKRNSGLMLYNSG